MCLALRTEVTLSPSPDFNSFIQTIIETEIDFHQFFYTSSAPYLTAVTRSYPNLGQDYALWKCKHFQILHIAEVNICKHCMRNISASTSEYLRPIDLVATSSMCLEFQTWKVGNRSFHPVNQVFSHQASKFWWHQLAWNYRLVIKILRCALLQGCSLHMLGMIQYYGIHIANALTIEC